MTEELLALADRCEAATGPDRELDAQIAAQVGELLRPTEIFYSEGRYVEQIVEQAPHYTSSLDAAMTLVPKGMRLNLSEWDDEIHLRPRGAWQAIVSKPVQDARFNEMRGYRCNHAATPALALCAAILLALGWDERNAQT